MNELVEQVLRDYLYLSDDFIFEQDMILTDTFGFDLLSLFDLADALEAKLNIPILDSDCQKWMTVGNVLNYFQVKQMRYSNQQLKQMAIILANAKINCTWDYDLFLNTLSFHTGFSHDYIEDKIKEYSGY